MLSKVPHKRKKDTSHHFDVERYIDDEIQKYTTTFRQKVIDEYSLYVKLSKKFVESHHKLPVVYKERANDCRLSFVQEQAYLKFKAEVIQMGYDIDYCIENRDPDDYYPDWELTVTIK